MSDRSSVQACAAQLRVRFEAAGAQVVEPPLLQPAGTLLDLYGEDIRARAYVTSDALRGEQMMRPDFTVPVVQMHMSDGAEPARYTYSGEVFRRQEQDPDRPNEYIQVGYEVFDRENPAAADAEVFALIAEALNGLHLRAATGDIGILMDAVRRAENHRPPQGRADAPYLAPAPVPGVARPLLRGGHRCRQPGLRTCLSAEAEPAWLGDMPKIGKRSLAPRLQDRIDALRADAQAAPISDTRTDRRWRPCWPCARPCPYALEQLRDVAVDLPSDHCRRSTGLEARI